jgi:hypothetical protein
VGLQQQAGPGVISILHRSPLQDFVYVSVAGPPSREAPQLLIPDPLKASASLVRVQEQHIDLPERGLSKRQYREQAAIIQ